MWTVLALQSLREENNKFDNGSFGKEGHLNEGILIIFLQDFSNL